ncbi:2-amino-4-hydroxy-6-hydroxymethyldihydropteridine diphosphokinase [uncultured Sphaerochaeta sp.]|uniref:2-amino-4-hydroxy-6- hydroxymethyldihydropteridine diphosphokinase n=1 Tax=uncultured Sphaerochaeta sp. TaxID=886478 RepID=UPI002A0A15C5|nr:2-amino-4-hydroxy-6-hydroxymethyldihydropteridine diphosphokinase [uncultured Sphaerochaeta sp.]
MLGNEVLAYIALGSNLGNKKENLDKAIAELGKTEGIKVTAVSSFLETAPVGYTDQPNFLNGVVGVQTTLTPYQLLKRCNEIEQTLKRVRLIHWGPRTIDLDILLYGNLIQQEEKLTIPHPRMLEREFVMQPLCEIAPLFIHPQCNKTIEELYRKDS